MTPDLLGYRFVKLQYLFLVAPNTDVDLQKGIQLGLNYKNISKYCLLSICSLKNFINFVSVSSLTKTF